MRPIPPAGFTARLTLLLLLAPHLAVAAPAAIPSPNEAPPALQQIPPQAPPPALTPAQPLFQRAPAPARDGDDLGVDPRFDGARPIEPTASEVDASEPDRDRQRGPASAKRRAARDDGNEDDDPPVEWVIENRKVGHRAHLLSLGVGAWPTALSAELWYAVPLLSRGFLPRVNDAFFLEFGSLLSWDHNGTVALWPAVGVRWDFYLTRRWATFFNLKMAVDIALNHDQDVHANAVVGFGGLLRIAERLLLRLELNYPQGAAVGLAIPLGGL